MLKSKMVSSGIPALDEVLDGLRLGDNVVWQVDRLENYLKVTYPFVRQALLDGRTVVYVRFAPHPVVIDPQPGVILKEVNPRPGFDIFSDKVNQIIEEIGKGAFYVFDNLSSLVEDWTTDELLSNFFQVACPFLHELDTVAYFALKRGQHSRSAVARIRDTTQVLVDLFHVNNQFYIHPLKVWDRYSSQMFLPHLYDRGHVAPVFQSADASSLLMSARKKPLRIKTDSIAPWDSVFKKLAQFSHEELKRLEATAEIQALRQELSQMIIGNHPEFMRLSDAYLSLDDLLDIRNRLIGSGRIGGKAAGMLLARGILAKDPGERDFSEVLEAHDSFFVGSDVFFTFLVDNDLFRLRLRLTRNSQISSEEFDHVEQRFLAGEFPEEIIEQFRDLLDYFGQAPIIVRSSSLLEDGFGNSFAGKYRSEFCVNQGSPEERMAALLSAVKLIYASTVNPDALTYRRLRGLGESDEQMAILIQRVSGTLYKHFFFPPLAGVAFSKNLYRWTDRIDQNQGIIRLVFGLGTRAVNRVGGDYPRLIAVSHPHLRPEMGAKIATYSQHRMDLLDLSDNTLKSLSAMEVIRDNGYPNGHLFISLIEDGYLREPDRITSRTPKGAVLTFNSLMASTDVVALMGELLAKLEKAYGYPVDTEFTAFVDEKGKVRINLVQCRPMKLPGAKITLSMPDHVPTHHILFKANRTIYGGSVRDIRYILYIDPRIYADMPIEKKRLLGRMVGRINRNPEMADHRFMMMGPGRWGSSNITLGVNVSYQDLSNTSVLVEIAGERDGHAPDVSYGTHFFLDLVEAGIIYLPLYPDHVKAAFNGRFFKTAPNCLSRLLPESHDAGAYVKVIDVPAVADGRYAHVIANPRSGKAICYLDRRQPVPSGAHQADSTGSDFHYFR